MYLQMTTPNEFINILDDETIPNEPPTKKLRFSQPAPLLQIPKQQKQTRRKTTTSSVENKLHQKLDSL